MGALNRKPIGILIAMVALWLTHPTGAQSPQEQPALRQAVATPSVPLANLEEYIAQLRQDVFTRKVDILGHTLQLSPADAGKFWPIYAAYSSELIELSNIRQRVFHDFAAQYPSIDDRTSDDLARRMLSFYARRDALLQRYYQVVKDQLGSKMAARFLQLETRLTAIHDLQIAAETPLLK
jgi:hypothetical protein